MTTAIYPGSFDPITLGHLNIIRRACEIFDEVVVVVVANVNKKTTFTMAERLNHVRRVTAGIGNVRVDSWDGLLVDYADQYDKAVVVRGLRALTDFEYEFQMALINKKMKPRVETIFLAAGERYTYLSSSAVRELASYGGDIADFVPASIIDEVYERVRRDRSL